MKNDTFFGIYAIDNIYHKENPETNDMHPKS